MGSAAEEGQYKKRMKKYTEEERKKWEEERDLRLGKRLAYLLRYGAEKEGLKVLEGGFVEFQSLMHVPMLRHYKPHLVLQKIEHSMSESGRFRFEKKKENGSIYVRALYGRRMERNPNHEGCQVPRLLETCMNLVCNNLDQFDLENFPDEFIINPMIHKLRRAKRLNNRTFRGLLTPTIEHLDLGAVYLTETTLKLVGQRCPHLRVLNLRECGYVVTDHAMENLLKKLPCLESLNLAGCQHLTDRTLAALGRRCPNLQHLNLTHIPELSQEGLLNLLCKADKLEHVDIYDNQNFSEEGQQVLATIAEERNVTIVLEGLELPSMRHSCSDLSGAVPLASVSKFW